MKNLRGLTLIEVLVAGTLMLLALGLVLSIHLSGQQAHVKAEAKQDSKSQVLVAAEKLKNELRLATVESAGVGTLVYRLPQVDSRGLPATDASGAIVFGGTISLELVDGDLQRTDAGGETTTVAHLGEQGAVVFSHTGRNVSVALSSRHGQDRDDRQAGARLVVNIFLPNQVI